CEQSFPDDRASKSSGAPWRIDVQRSQQQWLHQTVIKRAFARNGIANQLVRSGPQQRRQREIITGTRIRDALAPVEQPEWNAAIPQPQHPLLVGLEIDEGKFRLRRPSQAMLRADSPRVGQCMTVPRQQQMIAVVDRETRRTVEVRPA